MFLPKKKYEEFTATAEVPVVPRFKLQRFFILNYKTIDLGLFDDVSGCIF